MSKPKPLTYYSAREEWLNVASHGIGFFLSLLALPLLVIRAVQFGTAWHVVSFAVFGASLIILYGASTLYHRSKSKKQRYRLNILDHASIFLLIAGTYTPFVLVTLKGTVGWVIFGVIWGIAISGIILKLFYTGKHDRASTMMYVAMGWIVIFAIKPLVDSFSTEGLIWLFAGGLAYTLGAALFLFQKLPYNHAIFHVFVLIGSFCHFVAVYWYVLPVG